MKYIIHTLSLMIILTSTAISVEVKGKTYSFDVPDKVEFKAQNEPEFYSFDWTKSAPPGGISLFMMFQNPGMTDTNSLSSMVEETKSGVTSQMRLQGMNVKSSSHIQCQYGLFVGYEIKFEIQKDDISVEQYIYHLWDGNIGWSGQLTTATTNDVVLIRDILKSGKIIANQPSEAIVKTPVESGSD
jgi:hypothetical protein